MIYIVVSILLNFTLSSELDDQNHSFKLGMANCVESFNGNVYCASGNGYFGGLYYKENNYWKIVQQKELFNNSIRDLIPLDEFLLIASDKGVFSLDKFDNISELNKGLPENINDVNTSRVLKMIKYNDKVYISVDSKEIYYSDINKIEWNKLSLNYNKHIFDFTFFKDYMFISLLDIGLVKINLENNNTEIVNELDNEIFYFLNASNSFLIASTGFENFVTENTTLWENFNLKYGLNTNQIFKLYFQGDSIYFADNSNLYFTYDNGTEWLTYNLYSQLKTNAFVHDINSIDNNIFISLDDFGILSINQETLELAEENISNYKVNQIKSFSSTNYYNISNLNFTYLYKIVNNKPEIVFSIINDIIMDFSILNSKIAILTQYNGLQISENGTFWEYYPLPSNLNYNYDKQKVILSQQGVSITNINNEMFSFFSSDKGISWNKIEVFNGDTILDFINYNDLVYAYSNSKIFRFNENLIDWETIYITDNISDIIVKDGIYTVENSNIYRLNDFIPILLQNSNGAEKLISSSLALFDDNTIRYNYKDNWIILYKFQYLSNEDITDIQYIDDSHIQFGTKYLGLFDFYLNYLSIESNIDKSLIFENSIYKSEEIFNLRIIDINGFELLNKNNLTQYDIRSIENTKCLLIFEFNKKVIVKKHLID